VRSLKRINPVHFILPAHALRRYVSTYYFFDFTSDSGELEDLLHPEWASVHYTVSGSSRGSIVGEPPLPTPDVNMTGPTGKAARIFFEELKLIGIGLLPLGWYRLVGCPAERWANKVGELEDAPEFALFQNIWTELKSLNDPQQIAALFDRMLLEKITVADPLESRHQQRCRSGGRSRYRPTAFRTSFAAGIRLSSETAFKAPAVFAHVRQCYDGSGTKMVRRT
jgi:hypothetical protein